MPRSALIAVRIYADMQLFPGLVPPVWEMPVDDAEELRWLRAHVQFGSERHDPDDDEDDDDDDGEG